MPLLSNNMNNLCHYFKIKKLVKALPVLWITFWIGVALFAIIVISEDVNIRWILEAWERTFQSFKEVGLAMLLFFTIFMPVIKCLQLIPQRLMPIATALFIACIIAINALPIVVYMSFWPVNFTDTQLIFKAVFLLMANAMWYYFFYTFISDYFAEKKKLYVLSASFKGSGHHPKDYLKEANHWFILSLLRPLFYYFFSFTVFTDAFAGGIFSSGADEGIIHTLFIIVLREGLFSLKFSVYFMAMLLIILPLRFIFCDLWLYRWEKKRNIDNVNL